jgi:hypothetical protein
MYLRQLRIFQLLGNYLFERNVIISLRLKQVQVEPTRGVRWSVGAAAARALPPPRGSFTNLAPFPFSMGWK